MEDETVIQFIDDDDGYFRWLENHPEGYVVNCWRNPTPAYLVLHRAPCRHIQRWEGRTSTSSQYRKVCAEAEHELHGWAAGLSGELTRCRSCQP
jgi:hypothetical protein